MSTSLTPCLSLRKGLQYLGRVVNVSSLIVGSEEKTPKPVSSTRDRRQDHPDPETVDGNEESPDTRGPQVLMDPTGRFASL